MITLQRTHVEFTRWWLARPVWAMRFGPHSHRIVSVVALLGLVSVWSSLPLRAQEPGAARPTIAVDAFSFRYGRLHPELPPLEQLGRLPVPLVRTDNVWRAGHGAEGEPVRLDTLPAGSVFAADALQAVAQSVVGWFNAQGFDGVWVMYSNLEATARGLSDLRPAGSRTAEIVIWVSQIAEVRTLARGPRFKPEESVNNPRHRRILAHSPLQPASEGQLHGDLFRQEPLERYLNELSAFPGKRVEASIAAADAPGQIVLDYLVTETKPWLVFAQASNTGTAATERWRGRLGFQHNQLTDRDDVLNVDLVGTPNFDSYGAFASYRLPLLRPSRLAMRVYVSYGDFLASDASLQTLRFGGKNWFGGGELIHRRLLPHSWELTTTLGASFSRYQIESEFGGATLNEDSAEFVTPYLSANVGRDGIGWAVAGGLRLERPSETGGESASSGSSTFGRIGADTEWTALRWHAGGTLYLDRFFAPAESVPVFAHELSLRTRGRWLLSGERLIPQEQEPLGGALTVRGYPEAVLAADEFALGTLEYAFHLPRTFRPGDAGALFGRPFNWRPPVAGQRADWDLILRGFVDYAYRSTAPRLAPASPTPGPVALADRDVSLAGAGAGVELTLWRNVSLRCDVGVALKELRDRSQAAGHQVVTKSGDARVHLVSSLSW